MVFEAMRWELCRAYGAMGCRLPTQRLRAGLTCDAPPALWKETDPGARRSACWYMVVKQNRTARMLEKNSALA